MDPTYEETISGLDPTSPDLAAADGDLNHEDFIGDELSGDDDDDLFIDAILAEIEDDLDEVPAGGDR